MVFVALLSVSAVAADEPASLLFFDDFSSDMGWTDESGGYIHRDPTNEWLAYQVRRNAQRRYYIPINAESDSIELNFRFNVTAAGGNGDVHIGLIEDLDNPGTGWPFDATGVIVQVTRDTLWGPRVLVMAKYSDGALQLNPIESAPSYGALNTWRQASFTLNGNSWTTIVKTDDGTELGRQSGTLSGSHNEYRYLMVSRDQIGGWEWQNGFLDDIEVSGHRLADDDVTVETIIENDSAFPDTVHALNLTAGDLTNDGAPDLVITKGKPARAAVFQNPGGVWDSGTLLAGPSITNATRPIVAPIRNDGQNWLVYTEHRSGNTGEWLRAHRYDGTTLVENQDIYGRTAWPGWHGQTVGDLDGDGNLEIWVVELYGSPTHHLRRYVWDPGSNSYPGVEIKNGGQNYEPVINPVVGDFRADGSQSLIWAAQSRQLDLVTYTPGTGTHDHNSSLVFSLPGSVTDFDAGEFDGLPGTDVAVSTWDGTSASVHILFGGTFAVSQVASGVGEYLQSVRMGDLNGDGLAEVYAVGRAGGIYGYDADHGWRLLASYPELLWSHGDGTTARWAGAQKDEVLFGAPVSGQTFRVIRLSSEAVIPRATLSITDVALSQAVDAMDINGDNVIDLVSERPMVARVEVEISNAEVLDPDLPVELELALQGNTYAESRSVMALASNPVVDFFVTPVSSGNETLVVTIDPENDLELPGSASQFGLSTDIKPVREIGVVYYPVNHFGYTPAFGATVANSGDYLNAVFPVAPNRFQNTPSPFPYIPSRASFIPRIGALHDAYRLWLLGRLSTSPRAERVIGIVPQRWFDYHHFNAVGLVFPRVIEVGFVLDGRPLVTAHELGHTYGLGEGYVLRSDGTCCRVVGDPTAGYWVQRKVEVTQSVNYMGASPGAITYPLHATRRWATTGNFSHLFSQFRTEENDPETLLVTGIIDQDKTVELGPMYRADGTVSQPAPGDAAIQVLDMAGNVVGEVPFEIDFDVFVSPITGTVPSTTLDAAPFALAVPYPDDASTVRITRAGEVLVQTSVATKLLHDAVVSIPDDGFVSNGTQRRNALQNKIDALDKQLSSGSLVGARNKLKRDIRPHLESWLKDDYLTQTPLEYTRAEILQLVDDLLHRLGD
jgi:hypothetical protein